MISEPPRKYCNTCLAFDESTNAKVVTARLTNPATGKVYEGLVCAACLERGIITRVTCRTFAGTPAQAIPRSGMN